VTEVRSHLKRARPEGSASLEPARSELKRIECELNTLLNLILKGKAADKINAKMAQLAGRKAELEQLLADMEEPPPLLHPEMATFYREQVGAVHEALPEADELRIDVRGNLAGILAIFLKSKTAATGAGISQFVLVAGTGSQLYLQDLNFEVELPLAQDPCPSPSISEFRLSTSRSAVDAPTFEALSWWMRRGPRGNRGHLSACFPALLNPVSLSSC
jgi:hypothetical protein